MTADVLSSKQPVDLSSRANPQEAIITYLNWTAQVDFEASVITAIAEYDIEILQSTAQCVKLDTNHLLISDVTLNGSHATYYLSETDPEKPHLGQCLEISLPLALPSNAVVKLSVTYQTTDESSAIQWLPPEQTAGKKFPYLFSQCQAIHARSLVPCQDCPGVKMTYEASVTVPKWATCVMSALSKDSTDISESSTTYHFVQRVPIPSYLLAIAVGELASIDISPRCKVWSEPNVVEAAAYEFAQTEEFLKIAESLTLPYQWSRYDLLCLPPSFPYGGMENPCLTFVTPTLLAGDRSLAYVVAHEIAHSWTGNLVTNATWEHFWLNEGWTMWLQRKIIAKITKDPREFDFDAIGGWESLTEDVKLMPEDFTRLIPVLADKDPDESFSTVPYEKGFNLLYALERRVGSGAFEEFTKAYLTKFKFLTVTSDEFRAFFESYFEKNDAAKGFDWETWFHSPGMPPETPEFDRTLQKAADDLAAQWIAFDEQADGSPTNPPAVDIKEWLSNQTVSLLDTLLSKTEERKRPLKVSTVSSMNDCYGMRETKNSEILFRYCRLAIAAGDTNVLPIVVRFITSQGRMKFVRPLYRDLFNTTMGKYVAVETFLLNKKKYHPIAAKMIGKDLKVVEIKDEDNKEEDEADGSPLLLYLGAGLAALAFVGFMLSRRKR